MKAPYITVSFDNILWTALNYTDMAQKWVSNMPSPQDSKEPVSTHVKFSGVALAISCSYSIM